MTPQNIPPLRGRATVVTVVVVVALIALCLLAWAYRNTAPMSTLLGTTPSTSTPQQSDKPIATVAYSCDQRKTLIAQYYNGPSSVASNGMPIPGGHAVLTLTDGAMLSLPQTISADGTRYANKDGSFIFWSKGNGAFVEQGPDQTQTYTNCVAQDKR